MKSNLIKTAPILMAFALGIFLSSCGNKDGKTAVPQEKIAVQLAIAELKEYPVIYSFSGKLEAEKQTKLSTRNMGQVSRIYVKPGQKVKQGDLLLQIRNQDILAKKAQLEANKVEATSAFESAEKDLKRFEALYSSKSASDKEMDDIRTHYQMAKARLEAVNQMDKEIDESIGYASVRAPFTGTITGKFIQESDMANPGMPLLSMESPSQWKIIARIPEADIARLRLNDSVKVQLNALDGKTMDGVIAEINPSATNTGNQFEAKVILVNKQEHLANLYSGLYATVFYEKGTRPLVVIPTSALVNKGQLVGLYVIGQTGNALLRWVKTGKSYGESIEILSGLTDGETYVQTFEGRLFDGALVENK